MELHQAVIEQIALTGQERQFGLSWAALQFVRWADAAASDLDAVQRAGLARAKDGAVMPHLLKVPAVAAAWALAGGLVADLAVFGDEPHGSGFPSTQNSAAQESQQLTGSGGVWQAG